MLVNIVLEKKKEKVDDFGIGISKVSIWFKFMFTLSEMQLQNCENLFSGQKQLIKQSLYAFLICICTSLRIKRVSYSIMAAQNHLTNG